MSAYFTTQEMNEMMQEMQNITSNLDTIAKQRDDARAEVKRLKAKLRTAWGEGHVTRCVGLYSCKNQNCSSNPY